MRTKRSSRGQVLIEFCLTIPLIIMVGLAMLEYGQLWTKAHTLACAARHAARIASATMDTAQASNAITSYLAGDGSFGYGFDADDCTVVIRYIPHDEDPITHAGFPVLEDSEHGDYMRCVISYDAPLFLRGIVPGTTGTTWTVRARAVFMRS